MIFQQVTINWAGEKYIIPPTQVLRAIAIVEEHVTMHELIQAQVAGTMPLAKLAMAYAAVLKFAGAKDESAESVYARLFVKETAESAGQAIAALLFMMVPPNVTASGANNPGNVSSGAAPSSKKRTKPSSVAPAG